MNQYTGIALALLALILVPGTMYLGVNVLPHARDPFVAYWAPIVVLTIDALLFFVAFGAWKIATWDRVGMAIVLPLLLAMASWAIIINTIATA